MLDLLKISLPLLLNTVILCNCQELHFNGSSIVSMLERKPKVNIVSFEPVGENIALGLDFLLPFVKVPLLREMDVNGKEPALININIAALASTGILAASSALVSLFIRKYTIYHPIDKSEKSRRSDNGFETEMWSMLNNMKLIYTNSSGVKVDSNLPGLLNTIDETFLQNGIDLGSCLQKALCQRIVSVAGRSYQDDSTAFDKIVDGITGLEWVQRNLLRHTSLNDVIGSTNQENCDSKYPRCKWVAPVENLGSLVGSYLKFT